MSNPQSSGQPLWGTGKGFPGTPSVAELQKTEIVFPPNPHYGGIGAVAHVEEFPRLFASQQGYALPRQRNVEPPVLRTAPMGDHSSVFQSP